LLVALALAPPFNKPFSWEKSAVSEFAERTEVFRQDDATLQEMSNGRLATWMITADMIRNHPAGVGLNNWKVEYPKYNAESIDYYRSQKRDIWGDAHNDYLQLVAELGLPFLLLGGLMIFGLWKVYRLIWTRGDETSKRNSLFIGMGVTALFTVMMFSFPLALTAIPICLGVYLGLLSAMASIPLSSKAEKRVAFKPVVFVILLLLSVVGAIFGYREVTGWHQSSIAKVISQSIFQPADNNPYLNRPNMLLLAQHTDKAMDLEPNAPILLRESILAYTNLSLQIDHERLSEKYRKQALETALRYLRNTPNDIFTNMLVATRLQVPSEQAIKHIGKAIALNPDDLQLYEDLKSIALPTRQFEEMLSYYEYYIPRFYNQKMNEEYAYLGRQDNQQERVINVLSSFDLARRFTPGSSEYSAAEKKLEQLIESLKRSL
jgi:tetratricopeptide (TPR) repeat protein